MNRHTQELYRLAELPAFIEEALSNVSLKGIIDEYLYAGSGYEYKVVLEIRRAVTDYAEQWVDDWMASKKSAYDLWADKEDYMDPEIRAIEAGVNLFSNPDCKVGLPE